MNATPTTTDEQIFLLGRPPLGEFLGFVQGQQDARIDLKSLTEEWRRSNDYVKMLTGTEARYADGMKIEPLPEALNDHVKKVQSDSVFQQSFQAVPVSIGMVELDRLVVFQKQINLSHVERLVTELGAKPNQEAVFRLCLPYDHPKPPARWTRVGQNGFMFQSPSNDIRFLDATLVQAAQINGHAIAGIPVGVIALSVGFGANYLNVIHANGRYVLNNGSHRAYALRRLGLAQVPCVVQHVTREEELPVLSGPVAQNAKILLHDPRPPVLKDYFDEKLTKTIPVPNRQRQVRVVFQVEQVDSPGG